MCYVVRLNNHYFGLFPDLSTASILLNLFLADEDFDQNCTEIRVFPVDLDFDGLMAAVPEK